MRKSSNALENMQRWAATDYRLAGSGVESDCKKQPCFSFRVIVFNYFSRVFPVIDDFSAYTDDAVDRRDHIGPKLSGQDSCHAH